MTKKLTSKDIRGSVRIRPNQGQVLDTIAEELEIKRNTLVRYAIDQVIKSYNDLQLEQVQKETE